MIYKVTLDKCDADSVMYDTAFTWYTPTEHNICRDDRIEFQVVNEDKEAVSHPVNLNTYIVDYVLTSSIGSVYGLHKIPQLTTYQI